MTTHDRLNQISEYIDNIKKTAYLDIENIENLALSKSPNSGLVKKYTFELKPNKVTKIFIVKQIIEFYLKNFSRFFLYCIECVIFKIFGKKSKVDWSQKNFLIDVFFLVDNIIKDNNFKENYFGRLYDVLEKHNKNYIFLPRLYRSSKNPFKLINLFNVTNQDKRNTFVYEHELLNIVDIFKILIFIVKYPFKQFKLIQNNGHELDAYFNHELFSSLSDTSFIAYVRYLVGRKIAKKLADGSKIISWQEFQNLEKSFNRAIKDSNKDIVVYGCEFSMTYKAYISMHITDVDSNLKITPHQTLLNGKYNYSNSKKHMFRSGVSLRYRGLFRYESDMERILKPMALIGYDIKEGKNILKKLRHLEYLNVKLHPTIREGRLNKYMKHNWNYAYGDLYEAFKGVDVVFTPPYAGTSLEAVACGVPVIIIASKDNIINPLVSYGKGEVWDIAFGEKEAIRHYNGLLEYQKNRPNRVKEIAHWYKENFFIEPTEENIAKAFELK